MADQNQIEYHPELELTTIQIDKRSRDLFKAIAYKNGRTMTSQFRIWVSNEYIKEFGSIPPLKFDIYNP